jgi:hypothetical protein
MSAARNVEFHLGGTTETVSPSDLSGRWRNELGSEMTIVQSEGTLTGRYQTSVGAVPHGKEFPLSGYVAGTMVTFAVDFGVHGSLTAWVGHHIEDERGERLSTLWHMARALPHPDDADELWSAVMAGADDFQRIPD